MRSKIKNKLLFIKNCLKKGSLAIGLSLILNVSSAFGVTKDNFKKNQSTSTVIEKNKTVPYRTLYRTRDYRRKGVSSKKSSFKHNNTAIQLEIFEDKNVYQKNQFEGTCQSMALNFFKEQVNDLILKEKMLRNTRVPKGIIIQKVMTKQKKRLFLKGGVKENNIQFVERKTEGQQTMNRSNFFFGKFLRKSIRVLFDLIFIVIFSMLVAVVVTPGVNFFVLEIYFYIKFLIDKLQYYLVLLRVTSEIFTNMKDVNEMLQNIGRFENCPRPVRTLFDTMDFNSGDWENSADLLKDIDMQRCYQNNADFNSRLNQTKLLFHFIIKQIEMLEEYHQQYTEFKP